MTQDNNSKQSTSSYIKEIRRRTRKSYSTEEKIRIILAGLRGEDSVANICRKEGIGDGLYYKWSKDFLEAGKKRLSGDTEREASSTEVGDIKKENESLKKAVAELYLENTVLKKSLNGLE